MEEKVKEPSFDPDLSPRNEVNVQAAKIRGLRYDVRLGCYVDSDGCPRKDRFGQSL